MDRKILVAYATKYGSTAGIAQRIGEVLIDSGWDTDVLPANRVRTLDLYGAVVLGSAVYIGKWRKEAVKFLEANEKKPDRSAGMAVFKRSNGRGRSD